MTIQGTGLVALAAASRDVEQVAQTLSRAAVAQGAAQGSAPADTVDLSEQMIRLLAARAAFETAAKVIETGNEIDRRMLDMFA